MKKKYVIEADIPVFCLTVKTFPKGIEAAFNSLADMVGGIGKRKFYGISWMNEKNEIVYMAAVEEFQEREGEKLGCEPFTIKKGEYIAETVMDWMKKTDSIKDVFEELMKDPRFDDGYPCVEYYKDDQEMICLVKTKESKKVLQ